MHYYHDHEECLMCHCLYMKVSAVPSHLRHVVDQQQRDGDGGDVVRAADLQDVPQAHDGRVAGRDVSRPHVVVYTTVEDDMDLRQVGVTRDVELTLRQRWSTFHKRA